MKKYLTSMAVAIMVACGLFTMVTGCKTSQVTTGPDGVLVTNIVIDVARTEQVKDVAKTITGSAMRHVMQAFPKDGDEIAKYARAVGGVLCNIKATGQFDPVDLEAAVANLVLPQVTSPDALLWVQDARDSVLLIYKTFYRKRFTAELPSNEWPGAVAEVLCDSINTALKDSGRPGVI